MVNTVDQQKKTLGNTHLNDLLTAQFCEMLMGEGKKKDNE